MQQFSYAQKKVKYNNDIFPLIQAKNYDQAIPMIMTFLSDPKNNGHANAHFQIGLYYEGLVNDYHIITDSTAILGASDTAVVFLTKAKALINEKELKKNDDFYQDFYRRDLRTGDFGIKISDVHLDIEKKLQSLKNINKYANTIYKNLYSLNSANQFSVETYKAMVANYPNVNDLYLMASEDLRDSLQLMMDKRDEIKDGFDIVRSAVSKIGKKGYSPELNFVDIEQYGVDALDEVDFFTNDIEAWDYGNWAEETENIIKRDVVKLKGQLISTNKELKDQSAKIKVGQEITFEDLIPVIDESLLADLKRFDERPLPENLLNILVNKNKFDFMTNPRLNERLADEDDVDYQLGLSDSLVQFVNRMNIQVAELTEEHITQGAKKHKEFISDEYGGEFGLIKYRKKLEKDLEMAKNKWQTENDKLKEKSRWGVSEDAMDSLYLIPRMDTSYVAQSFSKYYSIASMKDDSSNTYVVGLEFQGATDQGFIAKVSNARTILWKTNFDLGNFAYSDSSLLVTGKFVPSQEGKVTSYIYTLVEDSENNLLTFSVTIDGELKWNNLLNVARPPLDVKYNDIVKETIFYTKTEDEMENGEDDGDAGYFVIDRGGNVR
jgi:hypothetical protein